VRRPDDRLSEQGIAEWSKWRQGQSHHGFPKYLFPDQE
jgi:hypothetical protein